jgi:hypothetical protein
VIRIRIFWPKDAGSGSGPTRFVPIKTVQVRRTSLGFALAGILLVGVAACGSSLSRAQAAAAISAKMGGPIGSLRVFRHRCVEKNFERYPLVFYEHNQIARNQRSLERAGLATTFSEQPTPEECGTPYLESKEVIAITLTPKGAAENWPEHNELGGGWDLVTGRRELVEVTAIVSESDLARAEFTWRLVPTVAGEALGQSSLQQQRGSATFRRQDGGWQLIRIDARPPRLREPLSASPSR